MRMTGPALVVAVLLLAMLPPVAVADHAYSHRYIVYGRVVDAEGAPVRGASVNVILEGIEREGNCDARHPPVSNLVTSDVGEYFYCAHTHRITTNSGTWKVMVGNSSATGSVDKDLRKSRADLQLNDARPNQRGDLAKFNRSYTLTVTMWKPGETAVEGITVEGTALTDRRLTAVVSYNGNKTLNGEATTNDYGDATFTFTFPEDLRSGSVVVTGPRGDTVSGTLDTKFHASTLLIEYPGDPWYTNSALLGGAIILGLVVAGGIAFAVYRFMGARESGNLGRRARR